VPFCHLTFSAVRPVLRHYERTKIPEGTLGAAFREQRWSFGLDQREAAAKIGTTLATYRNWEVNRSAPALKHLPNAIAFLSYDWRPEGMSLGDRIRRRRTAAGLSISELAEILSADESTVAGWEKGLHAPSRRSAAKLDDWLTHTIEFNSAI
jgi:DNA-binding transcriptional regulator YiaG